MRKPNVRPFTLDLTSGRFYCISFTSELKWTYTNKREADRKATALNKLLTEKIQSANSILVDVYAVYRRLFFVMRKVVALEAQEQIRIAEQSIEKSITLSRYENGCWYCFGNISNAYSALSKVTDILMAQSESRKITTDIWSLRALDKVIGLLKADIYNFEKETLQELQPANIVALFEEAG